MSRYCYGTECHRVRRSLAFKLNAALKSLRESKSDMEGLINQNLLLIDRCDDYRKLIKEQTDIIEDLSEGFLDSCTEMESKDQVIRDLGERIEFFSSMQRQKAHKNIGYDFHYIDRYTMTFVYIGRLTICTVVWEYDKTKDGPKYLWEPEADFLSSSGTSRCNVTDVYNRQIGERIALQRACQLGGFSELHREFRKRYPMDPKMAAFAATDDGLTWGCFSSVVERLLKGNEK